MKTKNGSNFEESPPLGCVPERAVSRIEPDSTPRRRQFAALPYRIRSDGQVELLLITSLSTRRWIIPKGWPMGKRPPHKVAKQEATEEAGVEGRIGKKAIGHYQYDKLLSNGDLVPCHVDIFPLEVRKQKPFWPERKCRDRQWLLPEAAAALVDDAGLAPVLRAFVTTSR